LEVGDELTEELSATEVKRYLPGELRKDVEDADKKVRARQVGDHGVHTTQLLGFGVRSNHDSQQSII